MDERLYKITSFWANSASVSFVTLPEEFRQLMADVGFEEIFWEDVAAQVFEGASRRQAETPSEPPPVGLHLVYDNVPEKEANTMRCLKEGRIIDIQAIFARVA